MTTPTEPSHVLISDPRVIAVPIRDCGEALVSVRDAGGTLRWSDKRLPENTLHHFVRRGVADRLHAAQRHLPRGVHLQLDEGLRPAWLQRRFFVGHRARLAARHPDWSDEALHRETQRFVADPDAAAPHTTGGAVDVCLVDDDGREIDVGSEPDVPAHLCEGRCYTAADNLTPAARRARGWLVDAMHAAGFVNYFTEWWHWSFGDQYWAYAHGCEARYGVTAMAAGATAPETT